MPRQITKDEVLVHKGIVPCMDESCEDGLCSACINPAEDYRAVMESVESFGLSLQPRDYEHPGLKRFLSSFTPFSALASVVAIEQIKHSTEYRGVELAIVSTVIANGTEVAPIEPDGWIGNDRPLLLAEPDGTYTVRDGNHRCIGGRLRGDTHINAYVIDYDYVTLPEFLKSPFALSAL